MDLPLTWRIVAALAYPKSSATSHDHGYAGDDTAGALVANTWQRYMRTRQAFANHESQYSWDRHLYLVLSRYVWFNDLVRAPAADADAGTGYIGDARAGDARDS